MNPAYAVNRYRSVGDETASKEEILLRLLDGAVGYCHEATAAMAARDFAKKGKKLMNAVHVIDELATALDRETAPELTDQLASLYGFCTQRLMRANVSLDPKDVQEAVKVLDVLRASFKEAVKKAK